MTPGAKPADHAREADGNLDSRGIVEASRAGFGNFAGTTWRAARFALFARCAVACLGHDAPICTHPEPPMKTHWSDWVTVITLLVALGAAAVSDPVQWPDATGLIR